VRSQKPNPLCYPCRKKLNNMSWSHADPIVRAKATELVKPVIKLVDPTPPRSIRGASGMVFADGEGW
jgi:hypothetical protein